MIVFLVHRPRYRANETLMFNDDTHMIVVNEILP